MYGVDIPDILTDLKFYEKMSLLLEDLIQQQRESAEAYEQFLKDAEKMIMTMADKTLDKDVVIIPNNPEASILLANTDLDSIAATSFECPRMWKQKKS